MIAAFSELLDERVVASDGEPGVHRYLVVVILPDGSHDVSAWMTEDGAREAESEMEQQGCTVEVLEAEDA